MGTYTLTNEQFFDLQDRLTEDEIATIEYDFGTNTVTTPAATDAAVALKVTDVLNSVPSPESDPNQLGVDLAVAEQEIASNDTDIADLNASVAANTATLVTNTGSINTLNTTVTNNSAQILTNVSDIASQLTTLTAAVADITTLQGEVQAIEDDMQTVAVDWSMTNVGRRNFVEIPSVTFTVTAAQAGTWMVSNYFDDTVNGAACATQIKVDGVNRLGSSLDGAGNQGDSQISVSGLITIAAGEEVTVEVSHNFDTTRDLDGFFRMAKLFD